MAYEITKDCFACGTCISECPIGAISEGDIYSIDPDICVDCGLCVDVCPVEAIIPTLHDNNDDICQPNIENDDITQ